MTKTQTRSYTCEHCHAVVSIPTGKRIITLEHVKAVHADVCPGQRKKKAS
ncbi:MAG TPA: hypothetical protein VIQ02_12155 [Jiangellaceae bacterium]